MDSTPSLTILVSADAYPLWSPPQESPAVGTALLPSLELDPSEHGAAEAPVRVALVLLDLDAEARLEGQAGASVVHSDLTDQPEVILRGERQVVQPRSVGAETRPDIEPVGDVPRHGEPGHTAVAVVRAAHAAIQACHGPVERRDAPPQAQVQATDGRLPIVERRDAERADTEVEARGRRRGVLLLGAAVQLVKLSILVGVLIRIIDLVPVEVPATRNLRLGNLTDVVVGDDRRGVATIPRSTRTGVELAALRAKARRGRTEQVDATPTLALETLQGHGNTEGVASRIFHGLDAGILPVESELGVPLVVFLAAAGDAHHPNVAMGADAHRFAGFDSKPVFFRDPLIVRRNEPEGSPFLGRNHGSTRRLGRRRRRKR